MSASEPVPEIIRDAIAAHIADAFTDTYGSADDEPGAGWLAGAQAAVDMLVAAGLLTTGPAVARAALDTVAWLIDTDDGFMSDDPCPYPLTVDVHTVGELHAVFAAARNAEPVSTEFGVVRSTEPSELHRGPMDAQAAADFVTEFEADGGRPGAFEVVSRQVSTSSWLPVPSALQR